MFRTRKVQGILGECDAISGAEGAENLIDVIGGLAIGIAGSHRQLMPKVGGAEFDLQAFVIGISGVVALTNHAFIAVHATDRTGNNSIGSGAGSVAGRYKIRKGRGDTRDLRIGVDRLV